MTRLRVVHQGDAFFIFGKSDLEMLCIGKEKDLWDLVGKLREATIPQWTKEELTRLDSLREEGL